MSTNNVISGSNTESPTPRVSRSRRSWLWLLLALPLAAAGASLSIAYAHGGGRGGPGWRGEMGGKFMHEHMQGVLDKAGASDKQKAEIEKIWEGVRPQLKDLHEQGAQVRKQIQEALAAPRIDAAAIEKLRAQSVQLMDKGSAIVTRGLIASAQVLTPEQRQKIVQEVRQHHEERPEGHPRHDMDRK